MTCGLKICCVLVKHRHYRITFMFSCVMGKVILVSSLKSLPAPLEINQRWRRTKVVFAVAGFPYVKYYVRLCRKVGFWFSGSE